MVHLRSGSFASTQLHINDISIQKTEINRQERFKITTGKKIKLSDERLLKSKLQKSYFSLSRLGFNENKQI